jgi:hypothetical protein
MPPTDSLVYDINIPRESIGIGDRLWGPEPVKVVFARVGSLAVDFLLFSNLPPSH